MSNASDGAGPPAQEHEFVPYAPLAPHDLRPLLVVAPHPDDEVFGCGGLLSLATRHGIAVHVVIVTDGALAGAAAEREAESLAAAQVWGGASARHSIEFWRVPDRGVKSDAPLRARLATVIESSAAQWVIAPSPFEVHPDHRAVCRVAIDAAQERQAEGQDVQLVFCEIGQPLLPNALVDITSVAECKAGAMRCFASQLAVQAYGDQVTGMNRYRSYTLGPNVTHAEAYRFVPPQVLRGGADAVMAELCESLRRRLWSTMPDPTEPPGLSR